MVVGFVALGLAVYGFLALDIGRGADITDFESCVAAGNPVMESYPEQCADGKGNTYTRVIAAPEAKDMIAVSAPLAGSVISSPVSVAGMARGGWYFEASFPVQVYDDRGNLLGEGPAQAQGDWMTSEFVPFKASIKFSTTTATEGVVRFKNDNPSGLPENDKHIDVAVSFKKAATATTTAAACRPTGCSGQICSDQDAASTCEYREAYACYKTAECKRQASGQCGWTQTTALAQCLSAAN
jgi:hypothetical protein